MRKVFEALWKKVEEEYRSGLICSERNLQAILYSYLSQNLSSEYIIFIEPKVLIDNKQLNNKVPDIIITHNKFVYAIIEIKYIPHSYVSFENDLQKLINFKSVETAQIPLLTKPFSGEWNSVDSFKLDKSHYSVYLVIANINSDFFSSPKRHKIISRFLNYNKTIICEGIISETQISFDTKHHE